MKLNKILKIKYPLIQGGMANIATAQLAAAVSNAGGLGLIAGGGNNAESLRESIKKCKELTDKPYGVNIMLMNPDCDAMSQVCIEEGVPVITTGAGNPSKYIQRWKEAGIKVFPVISSVALAVKMERLGVDGVIAEGTESGGHIGEITTMVLVPQVVAAVKVPVIAAGGVASGKQLLAVRALGAEGIQIGTILLLADECSIHENYKQAIINAKDTSTVVTGRNGGIPVRVLKNPMAKKYVAMEKAGIDKIELEKFTLGSLKKAVFDGDVKNGSLMAGQVAGQVNKKASVKEIIDGLFSDYEKELDALKNEKL